jgi:phage nucleotide-binding protein
MAVTIKKLSNQPEAGATRRILIYGDSGAGKTHLIGSAQQVAEMADVLVCDIDAGTATLAGTDVAATTTRTTQAVEQVLWLLAQRDPSVAHIKTLVLDGGSELQKRDLADIAAKATQKDGEKRPEQDLNELQDYKLNKSRLLRVFRMARDIPGINVIISAWAKKTYPKVAGTKQTNKDAGPTMVAPDFTDGVADALRGYCDDVWYLMYDPASGKRHLITANYGPVVAKTRGVAFAKKLTSVVNGATVPVIEEPNFSTIWALYKEALAGN